MIFARKVWKLLVAVKDGLALAFLLLFFVALFAALTTRPSAGQVREGALLLTLNGSVVEEPEIVDPLKALIATEMPARQYRARDLARAISAAATDSRIKAVVLDLSRFTGGGLVHMEEIGAAMDQVRAARKPVLTYAQAYADDGVMLAAHASEVWVDPFGGAFVTGPGGHTLYYGALLDRLKITAHVFRVGTYKDFVEPYIGSGQSAPSREARQALYEAVWGEWQANVKKARPKADIARVTSDPVAWVKAANGDLAKAALDAGLVDKLGSRVAFGQRVAALVGEDTIKPLPGNFAHTRLEPWLAANPLASSGRAIGVVTVAGEIVDGKAGPGTAGGDRIARLIDEAGEDEDLAALVVRVDSPGGSVLASEAIRSAIERQKAKGLPVAVSMANLAASGGYWVSTPGNRIFAEPGTITGSIGIFGIIPSFERALAEYGVKGDGVRTTALSGQPDPLSGLTPEVESLLQANVEQGYARFINLVAKSRGKTAEQVDAVAQGRVWDGGTARQKGLVDEFGGLDAALGWAAKAAKLEDGNWHPLFLGEDAVANDSLLSRLTGGDEDEASLAGGPDLFGQFAQRQQDQIGDALDRLHWLVGARGIQAYCLECPAPKAPRAKPDSGVLAWLFGMLS